MKSIIKAMLVSGAVAIASTTFVPAAFAQVGVSVNFGDVSVGYRDGYWDSAHHWHKWRNDDDWKAYRNQHPEHYRDYNHDRDEHPH